MQTFSQRLAEAIAKSGKSKGSLASSAGVALSTVSRWLGGTVPKADTLDAVAHFLGVNAKWLLTGEGQERSVSSEEEEAINRLFSRGPGWEKLKPIWTAASFELQCERTSKKVALESMESFRNRAYALRQLVGKVYRGCADLHKALVKSKADEDVVKQALALAELSYQLVGDAETAGEEAVALRHFFEGSPAMLRILRDTKD